MPCNQRRYAAVAALTAALLSGSASAAAEDGRQEGQDGSTTQAPSICGWAIVTSDAFYPGIPVGPVCLPVEATDCFQGDVGLRPDLVVYFGVCWIGP